jgi:hypothetical protein
MSIFGKRRVIGYIIFKAQPAEPAIRQVQMGLFAQPPLRANAVAITDDQHANHQFGINRWMPNRVIEIGEVTTQVAQIETPINAAQKVIGGDVIFKVERVKQPLLPTR